MKLLVTLVVIVGVGYGVISFAKAAYGWFQMAEIVDEVATRELPSIAERNRQASGFGFLDGGDRYSRVRAGILKGAGDAGVALHPENVLVGIADNMLDVRLSWSVPLAVYRGKPYLEIPMSIQRAYALNTPVLR